MIDEEKTAASQHSKAGRAAFLFVILIGVVSLFADFTYEGSRSVLGPYLALLGASATVVGIITGMGEMLGYGLRLVSGRWADASGRYWHITILGYVVQMASVPALALTQTWEQAAILIILERIGKAIRNPPRDVMLSHAGKQLGGYGWVFGLHQSLDQAGAMIGPLSVAAILALGGSYRQAFMLLAVPAVINLCFVAVTRWLYPRPQDMAPPSAGTAPDGLPRVFWVYLVGAGLVAAGFADYPLIAYHLTRTQLAQGEAIAVFYAVAMAVSGAGSLLFGRLFDRYGLRVLVPLTVVSVLFAPLVFYGGFWLALLGAAVWGIGMGVHESIIPAAVAPMVAVQRRATAFGLFTAAYGIFWFLGSSVIGMLYDWSVPAAVTFCMVAGLAAVPIFVWVGGKKETVSPDP